MTRYTKNMTKPRPLVLHHQSLTLKPPCTIGLISDTHSLIRAEALAALHGSSAIIHAGDIGSEAVLHALETIAPVYAIRGNNDTAEWARAIPDSLSLTIHDQLMIVLHDLHDLHCQVAAEAARVVITGHSHRPSIQKQNGVLFINPGSAGPRRFSLPVSVATLHLAKHAMSAKILNLASSPLAPKRSTFNS